MCFILWCDLGSFTYVMAPMLSLYKRTRQLIERTTPRSLMNFLIQTASFAASNVATFFASHTESTIVCYLKLFQQIAPPFRINTYPDILESIVSSWSDWQLEYVYPTSFKSDSLCSLVFLKYLRIVLITFQWFLSGSDWYLLIIDN